MRSCLRNLLDRLADWLDRMLPLPEDDASGAGIDDDEGRR